MTAQTARREITQPMRLPVRAEWREPAVRQAPVARQPWWKTGPASDLLRFLIIAAFVAIVGIAAYFLPPSTAAGDATGDTVTTQQGTP